MTQSLFNRLTSILRQFSSQTASPRRRSRHRQASEPLESRHMLSAVVSLVDDLQTTPNNPAPFSSLQQVHLDGYTYFATNGSTLWKTDGTSSGTSRLLDSSVIGQRSGIGAFYVAAGHVFFTVDGENSLELWTTDGTIGGAFPVSLKHQPNERGYSFQVVDFAGKAIFSENRYVDGRLQSPTVLYSSNGAANRPQSFLEVPVAGRITNLYSSQSVCC